MKLREFMANSLPRVRGRKKGGGANGNGNNAAASVSAAAAAVVAATATPSPAKHPQSITTNDVLNKDHCLSDPASPKPAKPDSGWFQFNESRFAFLEKLVGKESPVKRLLEGRSAQRQPLTPGRSRSPHPLSATQLQNQPTTRRLKEREACEQRRRVSSASVERGCELYQSVEVVTGYTDVWCQCPNDRTNCQCPVVKPEPSSWVCGGSCPSQRRHRIDPEVTSLYSQSGSYGYADSVVSYDSQRGARSRSRIRTNPWLPSPRPSPYSVRSLSSPCASSRSPSPSPPSFSSSPPTSVPPSSSDNTSPATSHDREAHHAQQQRHHYRRHRRHHSEANASEFTREFSFDAPLTDTEQYYSTLDSGIGETSTSPDEKDKDKDKENKPFKAPSSSSSSSSSSSKKQQVKRKSSERDTSHFFAQLRGLSVFTARSTPSPSPKVRPKLRSKISKSSAQPPASSSSSKGVVVNRDSKFWDSDSSVSPPCPSKSYGARSPRFVHRGSGEFWGCGEDDNNNNNTSHNNNTNNYNANLYSSRFVKSERENSPGLFSPRRVFQRDILVPGEERAHGDDSGGGVDACKVLSPSSPCCDDIGVITSNIEQLAHNISTEYEDCLNVSFYSTASSEPPAQSEHDACASLRALYNIDADDKADFVPRSRAELQSRSESLAAASENFVHDPRFGKCNTLELSGQSHDLSFPGEAPMVDVSVQTDFVDDEEEEEETSGSDWLPSTGSGSDWPTPSNGSGSDWPISGGSGCDWLAGEGSGCATEEEGGKEVEEEEEEGVTQAAEGGKVWVIPDVMQDSTDTGYSSLSRDGRVVSNDKNSSNNNNNANYYTTTDVDSSDSAAEKKDWKASSDSRAPTKLRGDKPASATRPNMMSDGSDSFLPGDGSNSIFDGLCEAERGANASVVLPDLASLGAVPKGHYRHLHPADDSSFGHGFDRPDDDCRGSGLFSCTLNLDTGGRRCFVQFRHHHYGLQTGKKNTTADERSNQPQAKPNVYCLPHQCVGCPDYSSSFGQYCSCSEGFPKDSHSDVRTKFANQKSSRHQESPGVVPYPYDVTRFGDVTVPMEERQRLGSVSPCCPRPVPPRSHPGKSSSEKKSFFRTPPPPLFTSTPACSRDSDVDDDDEFCSCSSPDESMTSSVIYNGVPIKEVSKNEKTKSSTSFFSRFSKKSRQEAAAASLASSRSAAGKENRKKDPPKTSGMKKSPIKSNRARQSAGEVAAGCFSFDQPKGVSAPSNAACASTSSSHDQPKPACPPHHRRLPPRPHRSGKVVDGEGSRADFDFDIAHPLRQHEKGCEFSKARDGAQSSFHDTFDMPLSPADHRHHCPDGQPRKNSFQNGALTNHSDYVNDTNGTDNFQNGSRFARNGTKHTQNGQRSHTEEDGTDMPETEAGIGAAAAATSSGRSLDQVVASLEDKVSSLRHGKGTVQRKIREAREEETVRQLHRQRFQKLLDIHRKRVLLQTLQDLKQKLVSQSSRLQASYSTVLDMHKRQV